MSDKERVEILEAQVYELQSLMHYMMFWQLRCPMVEPPQQLEVERMKHTLETAAKERPK